MNSNLIKHLTPWFLTNVLHYILQEYTNDFKLFFPETSFSFQLSEVTSFYYFNFFLSSLLTVSKADGVAVVWGSYVDQLLLRLVLSPAVFPLTLGFIKHLLLLFGPVWLHVLLQLLQLLPLLQATELLWSRHSVRGDSSHGLKHIPSKLLSLICSELGLVSGTCGIIFLVPDVPSSASPAVTQKKVRRQSFRMFTNKNVSWSGQTAGGALF